MAGLLNKQISRVGTATQSVSQHYHGVDATQLLNAAKVLCTDKDINHINVSDMTGPIVYLIKLLMRQYGTDCLQQVSGRHQWVVPPELRQREEVSSGRISACLCGLYYPKFNSVIHISSPDLCMHPPSGSLIGLGMRVLPFLHLKSFRHIVYRFIWAERGLVCPVQLQ